MSDPPFTVSPEAATYIAESLAAADAYASPGLLPSLHKSFGYRAWGPDGRPPERFQGEHWDVCAWDPGRASALGIVPVEVCGRTLWIHPDCRAAGMIVRWQQHDGRQIGEDHDRASSDQPGPRGDRHRGLG